jgi:hypothetical protein
MRKPAHHAGNENFYLIRWTLPHRPFIMNGEGSAGSSSRIAPYTTRFSERPVARMTPIATVCRMTKISGG